MVTVTVNLATPEDAVQLVQKLADLGYRHARICKTIDVTKPMQIEDGLVWRDLTLVHILSNEVKYCGRWADVYGQEWLRWFDADDTRIRNTPEGYL